MKRRERVATRRSLGLLEWWTSILPGTGDLGSGHTGRDSNRQDQHADAQESQTNCVVSECQQGDSAQQGEDEAYNRPEEALRASEYTIFLLTNAARHNEASRAGSKAAGVGH